MYRIKKWTNIMINILLVDDHQIVRTGLKLLLKTDTALNVIGEANSVKNAMLFLSENKNVDVVITDINMPEESGLNLVKQINNSFPKVKTLVLSMHFQALYAKEAMDSGAMGYVSKDANEDEIIEAIKSVYTSNIYFSRGVAAELAKDVFKQKTESSQLLSLWEKEILKHIIKGESNKMIALALEISESTVNTHRYNLMKKLNAKNSADLVRMAMENELI